MDQVIFHNPLVVVIAEYIFTCDRLLSGAGRALVMICVIVKKKHNKKQKTKKPKQKNPKQPKKPPQNYYCEFAVIKPLKICSNRSSTLFSIPEEHLSFIMAVFLLAPVLKQTINRRIWFTLQHRQDSLMRGLCYRKAKEGKNVLLLLEFLA